MAINNGESIASSKHQHQSNMKLKIDDVEIYYDGSNFWRLHPRNPRRMKPITEPDLIEAAKQALEFPNGKKRVDTPST